MSEEKIDTFDYKLIRDDFHRLLVATGNRLEREWPAKYAHAKDGQVVLLQFVRLAINTYKTIAFICSDVNDGADRDPRLALSVPPLNRTILEIIVSVLYLLEDLPRHTALFFRAAWRDEQEMLDKYQERYGGRPRWDAYIEQRLKTHAKAESQLHITADEKNDLNKILRWPKPAKVLRRLRSEYPHSNAISYIQFLDDWLYRELSTQAHVEPRGLAELGLHFLGMEDLKAISGDNRDGIREKLDQKIEEFKIKEVWTAITLILSLVSEIELHFNYGQKDKLLFVWTLINAHNEISEEVYDERYKALLER